MYKIDYSRQFKKDLQKLARSGRFQPDRFHFVVNMLARGESLPSNCRDHALQGQLSGLKECHINPDLLLIYKIMDDVMVLYMVRIGSHSELF